MKNSSWIVSMIGAREHYAPARALHRVGKLHYMYTDLWVPRLRGLPRRSPAFLRKLAGRYHHELPAERVVAFNWPHLIYTVERTFIKKTNPAVLDRFFLRTGSDFAARVADNLLQEQRDLEADVFFGFQFGALETFRALDSFPIIKVLDQFDPALVEAELVLEEHRRWPGWSRTPPVVSESRLRRLGEEWALADVIFVNSVWTKKALIQQGVDSSKIAVGPLAYEKPLMGTERPLKKRSEPLKVLWLGSVILRKGIQYLIEAAKGLNPAAFEFVVVGPIGVRPECLDVVPKNMRFLGPVARSETGRYYQEADVFVLPTISDGFAITQIEAMAYGLPVITTPNCGEVVTDGVDGIIVKACDSDGLKAALAQLEQNRDRIPGMSRAAWDKAQNFSLENYTRRLIEGVANVVDGRKLDADAKDRAG